MNHKTLALLFVTVAATSLSAQAAEEKKKEEKKPTCMQELQKGKSVQANMTASIKCQERAIGRLALSGVLEGDNLKTALDKQKEFDKAFTAANKDKKVTAEEKKELQELKKAATSAVFENSWNEEAMTIRLDKMKKRIYAGESKGQLTAGEMETLVGKYNDLEALYNKSKTGGLSTEEKKKLRADMHALSKQVFDDKRDHEGNVAPTPDRDKDNIDETRRAQAARVVACFSDGLNGKNYEEQFAQLRTVMNKESKYLADGSFSKEEKDDLSQLYKQAGLNISGACGNAKVAVKVDDSGMKPADGPKSNTPADPTKKVGIGL